MGREPIRWTSSYGRHSAARNTARAPEYVPSRRSRGAAGSGKHVQLVIEVATETLLLDQRRQIAIRGGDQADIYVDGARAPEPFEFPVPAARGSSFDWSSSGISPPRPKDRSAMGQFEPTDFLRDGPGKCSALVPEQLALQQTGGDSRAVEFDERACMSPAFRRWMALAISSFPVPVSPRINTVASVGATISTFALTPVSTPGYRR